MIIDRPFREIRYIEGTMQQEGRDCQCGGYRNGDCNCPVIYYTIPVVHRVINNKIVGTLETIFEKTGTPKEKYYNSLVEVWKNRKLIKYMNKVFKGIYK